MKMLFFFLLFSQLLFAQTIPLPDCRTIKNELATIDNSFDNIVNKFKSKEDKISLVKTYFSEFSICGQKGKIRDYGKNVEFSFLFNDADYEGNRNEFRDFYKMTFKKVKEEFGSTHVYKIAKEQSSKSCYFYEKDKEISSSKRNIKYYSPIKIRWMNPQPILFHLYSTTILSAKEKKPAIKQALINCPGIFTRGF